MCSWIYRQLPIIFLLLSIASCKMSSVTEIQKNDDNKVNFKISGSKETGIQINN